MLTAGLAASWSQGRVARPREQEPGSVDVIGVLILVIAAAGLAVAVLPVARWGFTDDDVFILHYLQGRAYPPPIWDSVGRFFPLGHQEWRLLYFWTDDINIFYLFCVLQYACFSLGAFVLLSHLKSSSRFALIFILTLPPVLVAYSNLVVLERTQLMFLPWLLFFLLKWDCTGLFRYAFLALLSAHFMLYLKEPTVLFIVTVTGLRLASPAMQAFQAIAGGNPVRVSQLAKSALADLGLVLSATVFLALYFTAVPLDTLFSDRVYDGRDLGVDRLLPALSAWAGKEPLLLALLAIGLLRTARNVLKHHTIDTRDQLLLGATVYFVSLVASGLVSTYYGALPMVTAAIAVVAPGLPGAQPRLRPVLVPAFAVLLCLGIIVNLVFAAPRLLYRQDWTARNAEVTDNLQQMLSANGERRVFLRGHSWDAEMLAVYANGLRKLGIIFLIADGRYVENEEEQAAICDVAAQFCLSYAPGPVSGQLVVDLGNIESTRSAAILQDRELLWSYEDRQLRDFLAVTPHFLHGILRHFYDFW